MNILNYGFNLSTVRELVKYKNDTAKINLLFNEVISVKLFLFVLLFLFFLVLIVLVPEFWNQKLLYIYTSFLLVGELFSLRWFFLGMEQMKFKAIINLVSTSIYVALVLFLVEQESDFMYIPLSQGLGMVVVALVSFVWVLKKYRLKLELISMKSVMNYLKNNTSSFLNLLLPSTFGTSIVFLVGVFGLPAHVSFMQIGIKVTNAFSTVNTVLTKVFYPIVNRRKDTMITSRFVLISIGVLLSFFMFFVSRQLIINWLHFERIQDVENAVLLLKILSPTPFLVAVISSFGINGLLTFYKDRLYGKISVVATLCMIAFAVVLIPKYHFFGGALGYLAGRTLYALLTYFSFKKIISGV